MDKVLSKHSGEKETYVSLCMLQSFLKHGLLPIKQLREGVFVRWDWMWRGEQLGEEKIVNFCLYFYVWTSLQQANCF